MCISYTFQKGKKKKRKKFVENMRDRINIFKTKNLKK